MTTTSRARSKQSASHTCAGSRSGWRKDPDGRRCRMLTAATRLLGENGYDALRTREVAVAAGVSEGTLFHHFGSKDSLLRTIAANYGDGFIDAMFGSSERTAPELDVESSIGRAFSYVRDSQPQLGRFLLVDASSAAEAARAANRAQIVANLTRVFSSWRERDLVGDIEPGITAELCFGLVETALRECFARGSGAREQAYVREVVRAIEAMLRRSPGPNP